MFHRKWKVKRTARLSFCFVFMIAAHARALPVLENGSIEFESLRGLRGASIEFDRLRGLRNSSIEFELLRGIRSATIEFDPFGKGRQIETFPEAISFGVVELGSSTMAIVTITNVGFAPLTVTALNVSVSPVFFLDAPPATPFFLTQGMSQDVIVLFTPQVDGLVSGSLEIVSDDPDTPSVVVCLEGEGGAEPTPEEQIENIVQFIDDTVTSGDLGGDGPGGSGEGRLNALINMLEAAGDLISMGDIDGAIAQLQDALNRTDGVTPPPDFVTGPAAADLAAQIQALIDGLEQP